MVLIYETDNFIVESNERPLVSRLDGGNIRIKVKDTSITDRTKLTPKMAIELMRLTMIVGEALEKALIRRGIPVVKVNYHDIGNWAFKKNQAPYLHIHMFGRAKDAKYQPFPESVYLPDWNSGFYDNFEALNEEDISEIKHQINLLLKLPKYQSKEWRND